MRYFYSHIIAFNNLHKSLDGADFNDYQRKELLLIAEESIHHVVLDTVMSELSEEDKKIFLSNLHQENHEKTWTHLKENIMHVEDKIVNAAHSLLRSLHLDIY